MSALMENPRPIHNTSAANDPASPDRKRVRVIVANEPRAYREALCGALRDLRPLAEVSLVEPEDLEHDVAHLAPHLVICSGYAEKVESVPAWVDLYPNGGSTSTVCLQGQRATYETMDLHTLLSILDRSGQLSREPQS